MKKFLAVLVLMVLLAGSVWGNVMTMSSGSIPLSQDYKFYNTTLTNSNEVYTTTLTDATVSLDIQATGCDIYLVSSAAGIDDARWTIPMGTVWSPNLTMPWDANHTIHAYRLGTTAGTLEVWHNRR